MRREPEEAKALLNELNTETINVTGGKSDDRDNG
jgi:hypothetical protein